MCERFERRMREMPEIERHCLKCGEKLGWPEYFTCLKCLKKQREARR